MVTNLRYQFMRSQCTRSVSSVVVKIVKWSRRAPVVQKLSCKKKAQIMELFSEVVCSERNVASFKYLLHVSSCENTELALVSLLMRLFICRPILLCFFISLDVRGYNNIPMLQYCIG